MSEHPRIRDKQRLILNGQSRANKNARRLCLEALEEALGTIDPAKSVSAQLRLRRDQLLVGNLSFPVPKRISVLSVGKASLPMLVGALSVLGEHIYSGILVAPRTQKITGLDKRISIFRTGHPIPDLEGIRAAKHVLASIDRMRPDDLLLCLISGGASAMLPAPANDITLNDKKEITEQLIKSEASIHEINTVRRHLSELKGGRLVERCRAGRIISLIISDVPGNTLSDIASGLTAPDPTTFQDAMKVLRQYNLWDSARARVRDRLQRGSDGQIFDTPKPGDRIFAKVHNLIVADNRSACVAARSYLNRRSTPTIILTSSADMDARNLGKLLASVAKDGEEAGHFLKLSSALVLGGETTVDVKGSGKGGRNQEVALAALNGIAGLKGVVVAALGTDGVDGNSPAAGALVDGLSAVHAERLGLRVRDFMVRNDSYNLFRKLGDAIITGPTGTNVGDIYLLMRARES